MIHAPESISTVNVILDFVLVFASLWMVWVVRGIGGVVGRSLTLIVFGAIVLGVAHLIATFAGGSYLNIFDAATNNFVHRIIVLLGFVLLVFGFRQIRVMKD
ncbi:MAG: hypothetical protein J0L63_15555 [Anaerolineae bacterium]|nr:hypothetical protein [Anaerolineae bacterium]